MQIAIVDSGLGNFGSIRNMLKKVGVRATTVTADPDALAAADKLVLAGVGAFDSGMERLKQLGLVEVLNHLVLEEGKPVLGICLGMQLMTRASEEGKRPGLGWIDAQTRWLRPRLDDPGLRVPHMGWNTVRPVRGGQYYAEIDGETRFYFVHSYVVECADADDVMATTHYGGEFTCAFHRENLLGVQFHPEKSHLFGMHFMRAFAGEDAKPC